VSVPAYGRIILTFHPAPGPGRFGTGTAAQRGQTLNSGTVYADGRVIWQRWSRSGDPLVIPKGADPLHTGYVQQRLTPQGVQLLRANSASRLPASAWADRTIRPYVPSHYAVAFDRFVPDPSKMPSPAGELLRQYQPLLDHACQVVTTNQARALLTAFAKAGLKLVGNHARILRVYVPAVGSHHTILNFFPGLPDQRRALRTGSCG
jgi:hypothetical protein